MTSNNITANKKINSLTGARFLAISLIVLNHFEFLGIYPIIGTVYNYFFHNATLGVDYFFLLSGFGMMLGSIRRNPDGTEKIYGIKDLFRFAKRHVKKIYPIYLITLICGIPFEIMYNIKYQGATLIHEIKYCIFTFISSLTLLQSLSGRIIYSHALNGVCWFLSCLFCIYLVSPIIMKFLKKKIKTINQALLGIIFCIIMSFILAILFNIIEAKTTLDDLTYGSPYRRIFYVITGMLIAQIYNFKIRDHSQSFSIIENSTFEKYSFIISFIWFFIRVVTFKFIGPFCYIFDMIIISCDLYALALRKGKISNFFENKILVYLGNISMYIFLTHYLIRMYIDYFVTYFNLQSLKIAAFEILLICLLTLFVSILIDKIQKEREKLSGTRI